MKMSSIHRMQLPREILVGNGVLKQVNSICKMLRLKSSILILSGSHIIETVKEDVVSSLERDSFEVKVSRVDESNISCVENTIKIIENFKANAVLGVGGGKVIDVAKLSSSQKSIPFISIPTTLSHDGIASSRASIKDYRRPISMEAQSPIAIIGDVEIISKSPYKLTASGCGDIIAKYTAVKDWKMSHKVKGEYYGDYAANLALMSTKLVMKNANIIREENEEGLRTVLEALISCGVAMSIAGSSRPCSGSEHLFSHALDMVVPKPALHGEQCGIGAIMMSKLWRADWKLLRDKLRTIGAPTTSSELGIDAEYIIEALTVAQKIRPERYTILDRARLNRRTAKELALATGII
ncbi:MAG: NAD(P)-dependent glycerol-1-phosphate dehydrogenase [Candidatus Bathyarchaeota archaeon]